MAPWCNLVTTPDLEPGIERCESSSLSGVTKFVLWRNRGTRGSGSI